MSKLYEVLELEVVRFNAEDVIATSAECTEYCEVDVAPCPCVGNTSDDCMNLFR